MSQVRDLQDRTRNELQMSGRFAPEAAYHHSAGQELTDPSEEMV
jgi:hypothetical protein